MQHVSGLHPKFALIGHTMCGGMVDIQSATAENRRGEKIEVRKKKKPQDKYIMSASATQGGHNKQYIEERKSRCGDGIFIDHFINYRSL